MSHKQNPLLTDEFRLMHSKIIEEFQWLEWTLKDMYAKLVDGHYTESFNKVAEQPLGVLIEKLRNTEIRKYTNCLTDEDYAALNKIRDMRNYWCHNCFIDGRFTKAAEEMVERIKVEYEMVTNLEKKLVTIKIPEGTGKWRLEDFCKIIGVTYYNLDEM